MADSLFAKNPAACGCGHGRESQHSMYIGLEWHLKHEITDTNGLSLTAEELYKYIYFQSKKFTIFKKDKLTRNEKGRFVQGGETAIAFGVPKEETQIIINTSKKVNGRTYFLKEEK